MIVNSAYMYMGKKGPAVNPNIWENGVVNYPYDLTSSATQWVPNLNRFTIPSPTDVIFTLPLKKFTKIQFNVAATGGDGLLQIYVKSDTTTRQEFNVGYSQKTVEYNIPAKYQSDNTEIVLRAARYTIYAYSGVMA